MNRQLLLLVICASLCTTGTQAQLVVPVEEPGTETVQWQHTEDLWQHAGRKKLPQGYETEALAALSHFPELRNVRIRMRVKKSFATLKTRPTFLSMFLPKGHRTYVITISNQTSNRLRPLLFAHLPEAARIGIMGHELSHVVDFSRKSTWQCFVTAVRHISPHFLDSLEFHTDQICIAHGLGTDLEAWSTYIRHTMHTKYWRGAGYASRGDSHYERYMNPETIEHQMRLQAGTGSPTQSAD